MSMLVDELKSVIEVTRTRLTLSSVETYFFLMSLFATFGMIFKIFASLGTGAWSNAELLEQLFVLLGSICLAIMLGLLIYFTAMLSIYFDDVFRLENDTIYSSNFIFTRLFTPIIRALILLASLTLFLASYTLF